MAVAAVCMLGTSNAQAQEFTIQGDLVSSYVWRGIYQGGAASFQPTLGFSVGNFSLTAWGSTSLSESNKEIDLTQIDTLSQAEQELFNLKANQVKKFKFTSTRWEIPKYESDKENAKTNFNANFEFSIVQKSTDTEI